MNQELKAQQSTFKSTLSSISATIIRTGNFIMNGKQNFINTSFYQLYTTQKQYLINQFYLPLNFFYRQLPSTFSQAKINGISGYSFEVRFMLVTAISLVAALITFRTSHRGELLSKSLMGIRNAGMSYMFGGLVVAPEIYNPLLKEN